MDPLHSMLDEETAQQVRALVAKGALSPGVMATSDCKGDHDTLAGRGVEFTQEPAERPYGVEAIMRDDSGNWYSFTQRKFGRQRAGRQAPEPRAASSALRRAKAAQPDGDRSR